LLSLRFSTLRATLAFGAHESRVATANSAVTTDAPASDFVLSLGQWRRAGAPAPHCHPHSRVQVAAGGARSVPRHAAS
jgi:hypothetical protein